ncbi:MAG: clostripain-related cysteine peptidase [Bacteroidales bacterium]|nr:clostripain-related cysteine peptidase [Bacteroidales bacterium]
MKRIRNILFVLIALSAVLVTMTSCGGSKKEVEKTSLLIYIAGNNTLSSMAPDCMNQLRSGFIPSDSLDSDILMVYYHIPGQNPRLIKMTRNSRGLIRETTLCTYPSDQKSASVTTLSQVIMDAENLCPAKYHNLVLWSHSTGFLPEETYDNLYYNKDLHAKPEKDASVLAPAARSPRKSFGKDYDSAEEIDLVDLADILPFKYESIIFDSCLMGGVEVAYQLKDKCKYLAVSPTEIMAQGFPYYMMLDELFNNPDKEAAIINIAREYFEYYNRQPGQGGTVAVVKTSEIEPLATVCKSIFSRHSAEIFALDRERVQYFDRCTAHWLYDLGDIVLKVGSTSEYLEFSKALDAAVIYKASTPTFLNIKINKYSGLGMYLPDPEYRFLNYYYQKLAWNKTTGLVNSNYFLK